MRLNMDFHYSYVLSNGILTLPGTNIPSRISKNQPKSYVGENVVVRGKRRNCSSKDEASLYVEVAGVFDSQ